MSTKRLFAGVTVITCAVMMLGGSLAPAGAMTLEELEAAIAALQAELLEAQAQLDELEGEEETVTPVAYEGIPDGFTFDNALYYGMTSDEVEYLQIIMKVEVGDPIYPDSVPATGWFGPITKASVIQFQEDNAEDVLAYWGLTSGTGYVGQTTRAKLNELLSAAVEPEPVPGDFDNEDDCVEADFYWWDDACNESAQPASDFDDEDDCVEADFYWWDDACHAAEKGASDYDNEDDCVDADFFWYDDACNATEEGEEEPVTDRGVELSDDNPAAATLMSSSAYNAMLKFDASAGDDDWDITSVTVERFGISQDSMVGGILIQDEDGVRHGNVYTFSEKVATIVFSTDPITIPSGETQEVAVVYNLGSTATSGTIGAKVTAMTSDPDGLTLVSNTFSLATGASVLGGMQVDLAANLGTSARSVALETEAQIVTKIKFTENTSNEDVYLEKLTVYNNGNSTDGDLANWELRDPSNNTLASVEESDDKYVVFDLTVSPGYRIPKGSSRTLSFYVDVMSGASRTTQLTIMNDYDVVAIGKDTDTRILATADSSSNYDTSFPMGDITDGENGYNTLLAAAGTLTVTRASDMPTGTVPAGGTEVVFAKYDVKAKGEDMEVRSIDFYLAARTAPDNGDSGDTADESDDVFTGTVSLRTSDGVSRRTLTVASNVPVLAETAYTLSSYFTVPAGTTETISIVGNLRSDLSSADSFQFAVQDFYVKRLTTGDFSTQAGSELTANTLTGSSGSLTAVADAGWGSKSIIAGSAKQVGQYVLQTGSAEGVYISTLDIDLSNVTGVNELWLQKGAGVCDENSDDVIGSVDTSVAAIDANNSFSTGGDLDIPASSSQIIIFCVNFNQGSATGTYISDFDTGDIDGTGMISGEAVTTTAAATGQTMTVQTAGILTVENGSNPNAAVLHASESGVKLLDVTIGTLYEPITIDTFRFTVEDDADQDRNFTNYTLKHGSATVSSGKSAVSGVLTFSGVSETIPYYGSESYSLWVDTSDALTMGSGDKARVKYASVEALGDWSNSAIMASHDTGYCGAITTEPTSASSVGHYAVGDLVVHGSALKMVTTLANEGTVLTTGLTLDGATAAFATGEVSKFGSMSQAPTTVGTTLGNLAVGDLVVYFDASGPTNFTGIVTAVVDGSDTVSIDGTAISGGALAADNYVEIPGTHELASTGTATSFDNAFALGSFVYYYDAGGTSTFGVVTTAYTADAATIKVNDTTITIADADRIFALDADVSQEIYSTSSTYQYGVGDVVYHYDNGATSAWAVVTTGIDAGETMANLVTSDSTAASSDWVVRVTPGVIASSNMTMHDFEPIITASTGDYGTRITGSMQKIAIYDITAVGGALSVESLAVTLEGSGTGQLATTADAWEVWEGGERIQSGTDLEATAAATYTLDLTTPEEIGSGLTKTFTVWLNTDGAWTSTEVGMSLSVKIDGTKGQMASGLDWFYSSAGPSSNLPTASSPATLSDSEFPVYGMNSLTY